MKKYLKKMVLGLVMRFINKYEAERIINVLANAVGIDLLNLAYNSIGVLKYVDSETSGEAYVMNTIVGMHLDFSNERKLVIFDVGANTGSYTRQLAEIYPQVAIYCFEPNPATYKSLKNNVKSLDNVEALNIGLGSQRGNLSIYTYESELESEHASMYKGVLSDLHLSENLIEKQVAIETINEFCKEKNIGKIDFLKIDTEGFEFEVLKGAASMLAEGNIPVIQFEFNEMNIVSRVYLKDFYELLPQYDFFRIDTNRLISLGSYKSRNEIFQFQNILAVLKKLPN